MKKIYTFLLAAFILPALSYAQPANDSCSTAVEITVDGPAVTADNSLADITGPIGTCFDEQSAGDVWYTFTTTETMNLVITTLAGTSADTRLTIFTIEGCGDGTPVYTQIACNDDNDTDYLSIINLPDLEPGTYYIKASTYDESVAGSFDISIVSLESPVNDDCEGAIELALDGSSTTVDNTGSDIDGEAGTCYYNATQYSGDVWYTFTTTSVMTLTITTTEGSTDDTQLALYTIEGCGTPDVTYTEIACNDDASEATYLAEIVVENLPAGTYYIKAGTYAYIGSTFGISIMGSVGIEEASQLDFSIFPNPSNGHFTIENSGLSGKYTIQMVDLSGRLVYTQQSTLSVNTPTEVAVDGVAPGVYLLNMTNTENKSTLSKKIRIE